MKKNYTAPMMEIIQFESDELLLEESLSVFNEEVNGSEALGKQRMEEDDASWGNLW